MEDGEDPVRRRQLLAHLAVTAAATAATPLTGQIRASASGAGSTGDVLVNRVRDAMLGLTPAPADLSAGTLQAGLDGAFADFRDSRYRRLADGLPRLIAAGTPSPQPAARPRPTRCWQGSTRWPPGC